MVALFSIAYNGYDQIWGPCIDSHYAYAESRNYQYSLIGEGCSTELAMECAWVKIPLMIAALDAGHDWVSFVDSDAEFMDRCPSVEMVEAKGKDVYMAHGHSGRPNSGVFMLRNTPSARQFLMRVIEIAGQEIPPEHRVGWGENGAVIHIASTYPGLQQLDVKWNNNSDLDLKDYIRHYSSGKMRWSYRNWPNVERAMRRAKRARTEHTPGSREFYTGLAELILEGVSDNEMFRTDKIVAELRKLADSSQISDQAHVH